MTITAATGVPSTVSPPGLVPTKFGVLDTVTVRSFSDPHVGYSGFEYEADYCGLPESSVAACEAGLVSAAGNISVSVGTTRNATLSVTGGPPADSVPAWINWGDGTIDRDTTAPISGTHTYAANGTYQVTVIGDNGYKSAAATVTVTNGASSGPFTAAATVPVVKTEHDGVNWITGVPFVLYTLEKCRTVGGAMQRAEARAAHSLELGASRGVAKFLGTKFVASATDVSANISSTDVGNAAAGLEAYAYGVYLGTPVLHMNRGAASILLQRGAIEVVGGKLQTRLGTPVSADNYAQYTGTGNNYLREAWMWVSGAMLIEKGPVQNSGVVVDTAKNEYRVLAEQTFSASWECVLAGAKVAAAINPA